MSDVVDFATARARRRGEDRLPARAPDFELRGWLRDGEVDWVSMARGGEWPAGWKHDEEVRALVDAAWAWGERKRGEQGRAGEPAVWWILDQEGFHTNLVATSLFRNTRWRNVRWFLRQWRRHNVSMARYAWRVLRGRG